MHCTMRDTYEVHNINNSEISGSKPVKKKKVEWPCDLKIKVGARSCFSKLQ